jgi:hypothetical protein
LARREEEEVMLVSVYSYKSLAIPAKPDFM